MARVSRVERRDVVADVVADDHAVAQVVEKGLECLRFLDAFLALVTRDAVHRDGRCVLGQPDERMEGVLDQDVSVDHRDRTDGDQAVGARIQAGRFRIEHDEARLSDRSVVLRGLLEAGAIAGEKGRLGHSAVSHVRSAVNSSSL